MPCILLYCASQGLQWVLYYVYRNFRFEDLGVPGPHRRTHEDGPAQGMGQECICQTGSTHVWHTPICSISSPGQHSVCLYTLLSLIAANGCFETQHHASWHGPRRIYPTSVSDDRHAFLDIRYNASNGVDHATRKRALIIQDE